jgi:protein LSM14
VKAGAGDVSGPDAAKGEFNFDEGLSVFNKSEELAKVAGESEKSGATKYVKDDFFDSLSCDVLDRQEGRKTRVTAQEERSQNLDTFGAVALQNNYRRYGRGRGRGGRGRGGRGYGGGGRGRGRGQGAQSAGV